MKNWLPVAAFLGWLYSPDYQLGPNSVFHRDLVGRGALAVPAVFDGGKRPATVSIGGQDVEIIQVIPPGQPVALSVLVTLDGSVTPPESWHSVMRGIDTTLQEFETDGQVPRVIGPLTRGGSVRADLGLGTGWIVRIDGLASLADWTLSRTMLRWSRPVLLVVTDDRGRTTPSAFAASDGVTRRIGITELRTRVRAEQATVFLVQLPSAKVSQEFVSLVAETGGTVATSSTSDVGGAIREALATVSRQAILYVRAPREATRQMPVQVIAEDGTPAVQARSSFRPKGNTPQ